MSQNESTIVALKSSFLRAQIRILSQPLQPSQRWRDSSRSSGTLTDSAIAEATREVNRQLRRHTKAAYSSLAVRHVAEQIDKLYWDSAAPNVEAEDFVDPEDGVLRVGDDLTTEHVIENLADTWEFDSATGISAKQRMDRDVYEETCKKLKELSERRKAALERLSALRQLQAMLQPFENPQENVQPNLVTRDGKLADELNGCNVLSVRVGARLGTSEGKSKTLPVADEEMEDAQVDADERLRRAWDAT